MNVNLALNYLELKTNASHREIILQFRMLSRKYHPDKWNPSRNFSKEEGLEKFKCIANARDFLLDIT